MMVKEDGLALAVAPISEANSLSLLFETSPSLFLNAFEDHLVPSSMKFQGLILGFSVVVLKKGGSTRVMSLSSKIGNINGPPFLTHDGPNADKSFSSKHLSYPLMSSALVVVKPQGLELPLVPSPRLKPQQLVLALRLIRSLRVRRMRGKLRKLRV
ncbi:hypothetical protein Nepgr_021250 [Nepenthes gracilis]|uniref:Uncharacterized protein n=1 Tax=Nepenthes gracilis TaxID=150966 RepID=A0AAD3XWV4_NEPGR|nr:hypothetical protein Nepgr_021250 [Nepenthes gracilis]